MSLKRALGLWLALQVDSLPGGLAVFADDLANREHAYPACTVTEIAHDVRPLGNCRKDFVTRNPVTHWVETVGRTYVDATAYRLVVSAPSDHARPGQEVVDSILATIEHAVLVLPLAGEPLVLVDTEALPPESYPIASMVFTGRQPVPPDITGEPFLYRGALSIKVARMVPVEAPVENVIQHIHVEEE